MLQVPTYLQRSVVDIKTASIKGDYWVNAFMSFCYANIIMENMVDLKPTLHF